jgi:hypothetical protein
MQPPAAHRFLALIIFYPEDGGYIFLRNIVLHTHYTAISQKIATFITIAVRISNPTY